MAYTATRTRHVSLLKPLDSNASTAPGPRPGLSAVCQYTRSTVSILRATAEPVESPVAAAAFSPVRAGAIAGSQLPACWSVSIRHP